LSATYDLILEAPDWVGVDPLSSRNPTTIGWMALTWLEVGSPRALSPLPSSRLDYYMIGAPGISLFSLFFASTE